LSSRVTSSVEAKWSEPVIVLGRGVIHPSRTYKCLCYCIAGIGEESGWIRFYPIAFKDQLIEDFDIIEAAIRDERPERHRPETRKILIQPPPRKIGHLEDQETQTKVLEEHLDSGSFLHDKSWNGIKTLGLIQPIYPEFEVEESKVIVRYRCNTSRCKGHISKVTDLSAINEIGRRRPIDRPEILEDKLLLLERQQYLGRRRLWFVMGTDRRYPWIWLLVEFHVTA